MKLELFLKAENLQNRIKNLEETIKTLHDWASNSTAGDDLNTVIIPDVAEIYVYNEDFSSLINSSMFAMKQKVEELKLEFEKL